MTQIFKGARNQQNQRPKMPQMAHPRQGNSPPHPGGCCLRELEGASLAASNDW